MSFRVGLAGTGPQGEHCSSNGGCKCVEIFGFIYVYWGLGGDFFFLSIDGINGSIANWTFQFYLESMLTLQCSMHDEGVMFLALTSTKNSPANNLLL